MATARDGGPAFPPTPYPDGKGWAHGMSLRDWFAGQALVLFSSHAALIAARKESEQTKTTFSAGIVTVLPKEACE